MYRNATRKLKQNVSHIDNRRSINHHWNHWHFLPSCIWGNLMFNIFKKRRAQNTIRELNAKIEAVQDLMIQETRDALDSNEKWARDHLARAIAKFDTFKTGDFSPEYFDAQRDVKRWSHVVDSL
jgi:hypothetical protein